MQNMKNKKFENPELLIILFGKDDIILTSGENGDEWDLPWPPQISEGD